MLHAFIDCFVGPFYRWMLIGGFSTGFFWGILFEEEMWRGVWRNWRSGHCGNKVIHHQLWNARGREEGGGSKGRRRGLCPSHQRSRTFRRDLWPAILPLCIWRPLALLGREKWRCISHRFINRHRFDWLFPDSAGVASSSGFFEGFFEDSWALCCLFWNDSNRWITWWFHAIHSDGNSNWLRLLNPSLQWAASSSWNVIEFNELTNELAKHNQLINYLADKWTHVSSLLFSWTSNGTEF